MLTIMDKRIFTLGFVLLLLQLSIPVRAQLNPEIWGWMYKYGDYTGCISFNADEPGTINKLKNTSSSTIGNAGSAIIDGKMHIVYANTSYISIGWVQAYYYRFDLATWTQEERTSISDYSLIALETAQDKVSGKVYGEFYNSAANGKEWGIIDYATKTRTTIGTAERLYVALGITKAGQLYGVAEDGNLYKINKENGEETLIGSTGLTIYSSYPNSGEIDQSDDTFYFSYSYTNSAASLYKIDLATGAATKVGDFPDGKQIYGMMITGDLVNTEAPAAPTDLAVNFSNGSQAGNVSFKVPTTTPVGTALTGTLKYNVMANGEVIATGETNPGANENVNVTSPEGLVEFTVTISSGEKEGAPAKLTQYVGFDIPLDPTNVSLTISENGEVSLTWTAPTETKNGGYMGDLKYRIVRYPEAVTVTETATGSSFTETLENEDMMFYYYGVTAINGGKASGEVLSPKRPYGKNAFAVPYEVTFRDDDDQVELFSVIDANNDGKTWVFDNTNKVMRSTTGNVQSDDWLFSPGFNFKAGYTYSIGVHAKTYLSSYPTKLEVKTGKGMSPASMTIDVASADLTTNQYQWLQNDITVEEDGVYYVGMHDISDTNGFSTFIDGMKVEVVSSPEAPDSVTNLQIVTDEQGLLKATLSFTAPTKAINGTDITELEKVEILRDGTLVKTIEDVTPGQTVTGVEDDAIEADGYVKYTVIAYANGLKGLRKELSVYVGIDIPSPAENIYAVDNHTSITLKWDEASTVGANGGRVIPSDVNYYIYANDMITKLGTAETNSFTLDSLTTEGAQRVALFYVRAFNEKGASGYWRPVRMVVGQPYELPFKESFANGKAEKLDWAEGNVYITSINPAYSVDDDGGSFALVCNSDEEKGSLNTGKIKISGAVNPKLQFNYRSEHGRDLLLKAIVAKADGTADTLSTYSIKDLANDGWQQVKLSLADYVDEPYIIVKLRMESNENSRIMTLIDNIQVRDILEYDLSASLTVPEIVNIGNKASVKVRVDNLGDFDAEQFTVKLTCNGTVTEKEITETLPSLGNASYDFEYQTSTMNNDGDNVSVKAEVVFDTDLNADNNTDEAAISLFNANASPAEDFMVTGDNSTGNPVTLMWNSPTEGKETVIDDFESYDANLISGFGEWTTVDLDHGEAAALSATTYGHEGEEFAFMTLNPAKLGVLASYPVLAPHSGDQYLMAIAAYKDGSAQDVNDWLISPELPGTAQTISFWAKNMSNPESIKLLYSTEGTDTDDFTLVTTYSVSDGEWQKITFDIPEGAKYFAIQRITDSANSLMLMIDDANFTMLRQPVGYNIYRDGELLTTVYSDNIYEDTEAESGEHEYALTAIYEDGSESDPVYGTAIVSGIVELREGNMQNMDVYDLQGRKINPDNMKRGIYIINGKKVVKK